MDFYNYLAEDILVKIDRAGMLNSLELRSPFLDYRVIEFAYRDVPSYLKASINSKKILLKELAGKILPLDVALPRNCDSWNQILSEDKQKDYQFELCEKPVIKLPEQYKNKSVVIMDGPFMCIDPYGQTGYHVMGNVVHAIHETSVGFSPNFPKNKE